MINEQDDETEVEADAILEVVDILPPKSSVTPPPPPTLPSNRPVPPRPSNSPDSGLRASPAAGTGDPNAPSSPTRTLSFSSRFSTASPPAPPQPSTPTIVPHAIVPIKT